MQRTQRIVAVIVLLFVCALACSLRATAESQPSQPQLVILDTDIGDDIDDSFALALLLQSSEVKLLGISTAFGDTELRARLVDRYLAAVGRSQVPVYAGIATPPKAHFSQAVYAQLAPVRKHGDAVAFLLNQIRAHPNEITLVAIGPLFNLEAAFKRDPATFRKLHRIVLMGGSVDRGYDPDRGGISHSPSPEWNILNDPQGAETVFTSGVPIFLMPLDSTQVHLPQPVLARLLAHGSPLTDQLALLYHQWNGAEAWRNPTLFDPVAAAYAIRPSLCPVQPIHLDVDAEGYTRRGPGAPNVNVCLKSDESAFVNFLADRILGVFPR